jgi:hypothetical protein
MREIAAGWSKCNIKQPYRQIVKCFLLEDLYISAPVILAVPRKVWKPKDSAFISYSTDCCGSYGENKSPKNFEEISECNVIDE